MSEVVTGVLGALAALLGVFLNGWLTNRREAARWERDRDLQAQAWARDDAARSYEHRREAYLNFVTQWRLHHDMAWRYRTFGKNGPDPDYDWMDDLYDSFVALQIFGTRSAVEAAEAALKNLSAYCTEGKDLQYSLFEEVQAQIRRDLSIPDVSSVSHSKDVTPPT
jgi:hypothetical protein